MERLWITSFLNFFIDDKVFFFTFLLDEIFQGLYIDHANQVNYHSFCCQPDLDFVFLKSIPHTKKDFCKWLKRSNLTFHREKKTPTN